MLKALIEEVITKIILNETTEAQESAKQLGLNYIKFGRFSHPNNPKKVVARSVEGKLVRTSPKQEKPVQLSQLEEEAFQKDRDVAAELLKHSGPAVLSKLQDTIKRNPDDPKFYVLRDNIMSLIPLHEIDKVPVDMKSIYSQHKIKQMAAIAQHQHGSPDKALEALEGSINNKNHPLLSRLHANSENVNS